MTASIAMDARIRELCVEREEQELVRLRCRVEMHRLVVDMWEEWSEEDRDSWTRVMTDRPAPTREWFREQLAAKRQELESYVRLDTCRTDHRRASGRVKNI